MEAIAAACVYAACRCDGRPKTLGDVASVARVPESKLMNGYKTLNRELGLPAPPRRPAEFVSRLVSDLDLSHDVERHARRVLDEATERAR